MQAWMTDQEVIHADESNEETKIPEIEEMIADYLERKPKLIFTMGKGGVGKTTVASYIALRLAEEDTHVHLTTTDPPHTSIGHSVMTTSKFNDQSY